jgi:tetratricopeptide (TPR) repeat protein
LNQIKESGSQFVSYEAKPVPRFKLFLLLAVLFYSFSYLFTEFDFERVKKSSSLAFALCFCLVMCTTLTGCSDSTGDVIKGTFAFAHKQYSKSVSFFNSAKEKEKQRDKDRQVMQYVSFDLATAYSLLGEDEAAMEKYFEIDQNAPAAVRYGAYYNAGIIAHKNEDYEHAVEYFKKALEVDSTRVDAKINLELSMQQVEAKGQQNQSNQIQASQEDAAPQNLEKAVFEHIKENDQKQWKNSETKDSSNLAEDF